MPKREAVLLKVIELYKEMPYLWDKNHGDYKNIRMRNEGNKALLEVYKEYESDATIKSLSKKLSNLRTYYLRELKKAKESCQNGGDPADMYVPTLWYFDAMSFIQPDAEPIYRPAQESMETGDISCSSSDAESFRLSDSPSSSSKRKNKSNEASYLEIRTEDKLQNIKKEMKFKKQDFLNSNTENVYNESKLHLEDEQWEIIGKSIGIQLKDLERKQFFIAQKMIHDTIYYAQMGWLNENTAVTGFGERNQDPFATE